MSSLSPAVWGRNEWNNIISILIMALSKAKNRSKLDNDFSAELRKINTLSMKSIIDIDTNDEKGLVKLAYTYLLTTSYILPCTTCVQHFKDRVPLFISLQPSAWPAKLVEIHIDIHKRSGANKKALDNIQKAFNVFFGSRSVSLSNEDIIDAIYTKFLFTDHYDIFVIYLAIIGKLLAMDDKYSDLGSIIYRHAIKTADKSEKSIFKMLDMITVEWSELYYRGKFILETPYDRQDIKKARLFYQNIANDSKHPGYIFTLY